MQSHVHRFSRFNLT